MNDVLINGHVVLADVLRWTALCLGFFIFGMNLTMLGRGWASYFRLPRRHLLILLWIVGQQTLIATFLLEIYLNMGTPLRFITIGALVALGFKFLGAIGVFCRIRRKRRR